MNFFTIIGLITFIFLSLKILLIYFSRKYPKKYYKVFNCPNDHDTISRHKFGNCKYKCNTCKQKI